MTKVKLIIGLVVILAIVGLGITVSIQNKKIKFLNDDLIVATTNVKAYEQEAATLKDKTMKFQLTVDQLNASNDSLIQKLNKVRKDNKVKDSKIKELEYIASENKKTETIYLRDTLFIKNTLLDTLVSDYWASLKLHIEYPNIIEANYSFKNETSIISSLERVTVDPLKKCWLGRLFQKKQNIVTVNVIEENPYCEIKEQKFINIVE